MLIIDYSQLDLSQIVIQLFFFFLFHFCSFGTAKKRYVNADVKKLVPINTILSFYLFCDYGAAVVAVVATVVVAGGAVAGHKRARRSWSNWAFTVAATVAVVAWMVAQFKKIRNID